jgi:alpha-glucuronidase
MALGESVYHLDEQDSPYAPVQMLNQWDNLDGTIEREAATH